MVFSNLYKNGILIPELARHFWFSLPIKTEVEGKIGPFPDFQVDKDTKKPYIEIIIPSVLKNGNGNNIIYDQATTISLLYNEISKIYHDECSTKNWSKVMDERTKFKNKMGKKYGEVTPLWLRKKAEDIFKPAIDKSLSLIGTNLFNPFKEKIENYLKELVHYTVKEDISRATVEDINESASNINPFLATMNSFFAQGLEKEIQRHGSDRTKYFDEVFRYNVILPIIDSLYQEIAEKKIIPESVYAKTKTLFEPGMSIVWGESNLKIAKKIAMLNTILEYDDFIKIQNSILPRVENLSKSDKDFCNFFGLEKGSLDKILVDPHDPRQRDRVKNILLYNYKLIKDSLKTIDPKTRIYIDEIGNKIQIAETCRIVYNHLNFISEEEAGKRKTRTYNLKNPRHLSELEAVVTVNDTFGSTSLIKTYEIGVKAKNKRILIGDNSIMGKNAKKYRRTKSKVVGDQLISCFTGHFRALCGLLYQMDFFREYSKEPEDPDIKKLPEDLLISKKGKAPVSTKKEKVVKGNKLNYSSGIDLGKTYMLDIDEPDSTIQLATEVGDTGIVINGKDIRNNNMIFFTSTNDSKGNLIARLQEELTHLQGLYNTLPFEELEKILPQGIYEKLSKLPKGTDITLKINSKGIDNREQIIKSIKDPRTTHFYNGQAIIYNYLKKTKGKQDIVEFLDDKDKAGLIAQDLDTKELQFIDNVSEVSYYSTFLGKNYPFAQRNGMGNYKSKNEMTYRSYYSRDELTDEAMKIIFELDGFENEIENGSKTSKSKEEKRK